MKKPTSVSGIFALGLMTLLFTSCEKDKPLSEAILGKWEVQTEKQTYSQQDVVKFEYIYYYVPGELAFEFTSGGSVINHVDGDVFGMTTYTLSGNDVILEFGANDLVWESASVSDDTMTWIQSGTDIIGEESFDVEILYTAKKVN